MLSPFIAIDLAASYQQGNAEARVHGQLLRQTNLDQRVSAGLFSLVGRLGSWISAGKLRTWRPHRADNTGLPEQDKLSNAHA
jgi:hypothetical protein